MQDGAIRERARRGEVAALRVEELESRVAALQGDEAVELLAREEWGFVFPGEEAYAIVGLGATVPPSTTTTTAPPAEGGDGTTPATATTGTN